MQKVIKYNRGLAHKSKMRGFTLIELSLVVAMIGILTGLSIPVLKAFTNNNNISSATSLIINELEHAKLLSQAEENDDQWGLKIEDNTVTVFKGGSYVARDSSFDHVADLPSNITISGDQEIVFDKFTGYVSEQKTVNLIMENDTRASISINVKGLINQND